MVELIERATYATPTPEPTRTPSPPWHPGETVDDAVVTLRSLLRTFASAAIWLAIVVVPFAIPVLVAVWLLSRIAARRSRPPGA
jgi:hypothetical protein